MAQANSREIVSSEAYATAANFEQIFIEDMSVLYLLSFLLTGDRDKAEECFVAGVEESTKSNRVFKEWARSWARRTIIQSAIRLIAPRESSAGARREPAFSRDVDDQVPLLLRAEVYAILELPPFERFVFVLSSLERYSDQDCSILLGCARRDISPARARALRDLARLLGLQPTNQGDFSSEKSTLLENSGLVMELMIARHFATSTWNLSA
jgi:DNA-directed RNA polymerase specialized sigma24 family protein